MTALIWYNFRTEQKTSYIPSVGHTYTWGRRSLLEQLMRHNTLLNSEASTTFSRAKRVAGPPCVTCSIRVNQLPVGSLYFASWSSVVIVYHPRVASEVGRSIFIRTMYKIVIGNVSLHYSPGALVHAVVSLIDFMHQIVSIRIFFSLSQS